MTERLEREIAASKKDFVALADAVVLTCSQVDAALESLPANECITLSVFRDLLTRAFQRFLDCVEIFERSPEAAEILARSSLEATISCQFMLRQSHPGDELVAYFKSYIADQDRYLKAWEEAERERQASSPHPDWKITESAIEERKKTLGVQKTFVDQLSPSFVLQTNAQTKWLSAYDRFAKIGLRELYRTVYKVASSQVHSDAEDLVNFYINRYEGARCGVSESSIKANRKAVDRAFSLLIVAASASHLLDPWLDLGRIFGIEIRNSNFDDVVQRLVRTAERISQLCVVLKAEYDDLFKGGHRSTGT